MAAAALVGTAVPAQATADAQCLASKPTISANPTKILTIGDSLTSAAAGDYTWRYFLWKNLVTNGGTAPAPATTSFQLVGPSTDLVDPIRLVRDSTDYRCEDFDQANGGIPGSFLAADYLKAENTATVVQNMVSSSSADVVVVFAGLNDLYGSVSRGIAALSPAQLLAKDADLAAKVQATNPNATILFLTVPTSDAAGAPGSVLANAHSYNTSLLTTASTWSAGGSQVGAVSAAQHWGGHDLTYDSIHPNPQGEADIGADVADGLEALGVGAGAKRPVPDLSALAGPRDPAVLGTPTANGAGVDLSWQLPVGAIGGQVQRKDYTAGTDWADIGAPVFLSSAGSGGPYILSYTDNAYPAGHVVRYRVRSAKGTLVTYTGNATTYQYSSTVVSNAVTYPVGAALPPLGKVAGLTATAGIHSVVLSWTATPGADRYLVTARRGTVATTSFASTSSATIKNLVAGTPYTFTVVAQSLDGQPAGPAAAVGAIPRAYALARPVVKVAKSGKRFTATWAAVAHATGYQVQYKAPGRTTWAVVQRSTARSWLGPATKKGKKYQVRVRAYDGAAPGPWSATATYKGR